VLVHRTQIIIILLAQPEGLDAEADAEADRIIAEITSGVLSNAGAAPAAAVPGKHAAAEEAAPEAQVLVSIALHGIVLWFMAVVLPPCCLRIHLPRLPVHYFHYWCMWGYTVYRRRRQMRALKSSCRDCMRYNSLTAFTLLYGWQCP
jgi:hypothetical protein